MHRTEQELENLLEEQEVGTILITRDNVWRKHDAISWDRVDGRAVKNWWGMSDDEMLARRLFYEGIPANSWSFS